MKTVVHFVLACGLLTIVSCARPEADVPASDPMPKPDILASDPIVAVGHGAFIGPDVGELTVDAAFIRRAQRFYRDRMERDGGRALGQEIHEKWSLIDRLIDDDIVANALKSGGAGRAGG